MARDRGNWGCPFHLLWLAPSNTSHQLMKCFYVAKTCRPGMCVFAGSQSSSHLSLLFEPLVAPHLCLLTGELREVRSSL
jgi:hypothetical protein